VDVPIVSETGTLAEEAVRLIEALQTWARGATSGQGCDRIANGAPECRLCPVCLLLGAVRGAQPQTFEYLLDAAESITAALRSALEVHAAASHSGRGVERIDIG